MIKSWTIGGLSKMSKVKVPTIRYYESIDLLPAPDRSTNGRRTYGEADARRLGFIKHARDLGFPIEAIRSLLDLADHPAQPCVEADEIVREQLSSVESKIEQLSALRSELGRMAQMCAGGKIAECRVIESLAGHSNCLADHTTPSTISSSLL